MALEWFSVEWCAVKSCSFTHSLTYASSLPKQCL